MNVAREVAALRRDLRGHEEEIERVATLRAVGDANILALPRFVDKHLTDIRVRIAELKAEIGKLEADR